MGKTITYLKSGIAQYGVTILLIMIFLAGIYFIFWMGNSNEVTKMEKELHHLKTKLIASEAAISPAESNDESTEVDDLQVGNTADLCPTLLIKRGKQLMLFNKNLPEIPRENPLFFDNLDQYIAYVKLQRDVYKQSCPVLFLQQESNAQGEDVYRMRRPQNNDITVDPLLLGSATDYFQNTSNVSPQFTPPSGPTAFNMPPRNHSIHLALSGSPMQPDAAGAKQPTIEYVDASRHNKPYNQGTYGFDPSSQYTGRYTVLDQIHDSTKMQNPQGLSDNAMDLNWGGASFTSSQIQAGKYAGNEVKPPTVVSNLAAPPQ
jgi:hypothetical protein